MRESTQIFIVSVILYLLALFFHFQPNAGELSNSILNTSIIVVLGSVVFRKKEDYELRNLNQRGKN